MNVFSHGGDIYGLDKDVIDFSASVNPLGMPEAAKRAAVRSVGDCGRYPDPRCRELKAALSAFHGVPPEWLTCGGGAAELIYKIALGLRPGRALLPAPAFSEYERALELSGCRITRHFLKPENGFGLTDEILPEIRPGLDLVFLANPNNPTGAVARRPLMLSLAERCREAGAILAVDECFTDFLEDYEDVTLLKYVPDFRNVIIIKAFTKFYAMAGLRLGYAICADAALNGRIDSALQPWGVSTVASKCGIAALSDADYVHRTRTVIARGRRKLSRQLIGLGFTVYDSRANFIFFKSDDTELGKKLLRRGVLIRDCADFPGLGGGFYRVAVRGQADNDYLIECMKGL